MRSLSTSVTSRSIIAQSCPNLLHLNPQLISNRSIQQQTSDKTDTTTSKRWQIATISNWMSKIRGKKSSPSSENDSLTVSRGKSEELIRQETDTNNIAKTGQIRYQRNMPGKPVIWEGEIVPELINPKRKKGKTHFRHWPTLKKAILNTPSGKRV